MKNQKRRSIFLLLLCMALMCIPIQASAGSTTLTATVPEQPADTMEAPKGAKTLGEVPLPAGWVWEEPDTELVPGDDLTATALYKDEDGKVLAERTITVRMSRMPEATATPTPKPTETPAPTPEATVTPEPTEAPEATVTPETTITPTPTATPEATITPEATVTPETTITPEATVTPAPTITPKPNAVKTGDGTPVGFWVLTALGAAGIIFVAGRRKAGKK